MGFADKVRLMNLLMEDFRTYKEIPIKASGSIGTCKCDVFVFVGVVVGIFPPESSRLEAQGAFVGVGRTYSVGKGGWGC